MRKLLIGVVAATLALAACGGSSKNNTATGGSTNTTASKSSSGDTSTTASGGSGSDDLSKLAEQYSKAKIKITYTSTGGDTITLAQDGNGKSAFTTGTSTIYSDGKATVTCDGTGTTAHCTELPGTGLGANIGASFASSFSAIASGLATLGTGDRSSETIAGRDAACVTYKASDFLGKLGSLAILKGATPDASGYDPSDTATICVDKQTGFVLKIADTKKGVAESQLTATAVSEPTDADFTPPVTPETIPGGTLPGGITIPGSGG